MEISIENQPRDSRSFGLSSLGLTVMCHLEHLLVATSVDLSNNLLRDLGSVYYLQSVRELNLGNNQLRNCQGLEKLPALETVDVRNNGKLNLCLGIFLKNKYLHLLCTGSKIVEMLHQRNFILLKQSVFWCVPLVFRM
jgi:hypothetical protein